MLPGFRSRPEAGETYSNQPGSGKTETAAIENHDRYLLIDAIETDLGCI